LGEAFEVVMVMAGFSPLKDLYEGFGKGLLYFVFCFYVDFSLFLTLSSL
jgi:hypothetical protein